MAAEPLIDARYDAGMRRAGIVIGVTIALVGAIWILQGLSVTFAPTSFMTGDRQWTLHGIIAVAIGLTIVRWSVRRS